MSRSYVDHLNEKIEILYITLSTLQQQQCNSNITATVTTNNVDKLIMIINDIEKYKNTHAKYLQNRSSIVKQQQQQQQSGQQQQPLSVISNNIYDHDHDHDLPHLDRAGINDNNNHVQLSTLEAVATTVADDNDDYTLGNEVLNDCYKKCATFIRSPYTEQLRNLISSSRKKLQMKASQGTGRLGVRDGEV
jgi:hypothetical protein